MTKYGMDHIELIQRGEKPRKVGITMMADQGLALSTVEGWLEAWGEYIDYSKLYHMTPGMMAESFIEKKIALYKKYDVYVTAGGIYLEVAHCQNKIDQSVAYLKEIGFGAVEISENFVEFTPAEKESLIKKCIKAGLRVVYEYGDKYYQEGQQISVDHVADKVLKAKELGVTHTIVEESILDLWLGKDGKGKEAHKLVELADKVGRDHIVWEAGQPAQNAHLIRLFGPEVNLGPNIPPDQVMWLEAGRRGFGRAFGYQFVVDEYAKYKENQAKLKKTA
jgi:phosphosulfolactate synthase